MADNPVRHDADDGSIYAVEIVPPESDTYDAKYHVDLVRASVDAYGLRHEQRLTAGRHNSWGEAEEHLHELEERLTENGLAGWHEDTERLQSQPYAEDVVYIAVTYPPNEQDGDDRSATHLLAIAETGIASAALAVGDRKSIEQVVERVDMAMADEGVDAALVVAQREAERQSHHTPATPLFDPDDRAVRHVDGGDTTHWFAIVKRDETETEPYELRYFRALELDDDKQYQDSYPVMPLPDDDPASTWALPALEMYLQKGDVYMAQQFAHDVADAYGLEFPEPWDLPSLNPRPEYYFGYGVSPSNQPALEAVKTWMNGAERRFDTLTVGEYGTFDEAAVDERQLDSLLDQQGLEAAMNRAESMSVAAGYLDPIRDDPRIFFEEDAPPDMFVTKRQRELQIPSYGLGAIAANGESFLDVVKTWGEHHHERLVIPQPDWEAAVRIADLAGDLMESGHLQEAMRLVERAGVAGGVIDPERDDPRMFTHGPPDPFQTMREDEIDDNLAHYGVTWAEVREWSEPQQPDVNSLQASYHRLDVRQAQSPDGTVLGYAIIASAYPQLPADFDDEEIDDTRYPTKAWALDVAHFEAEQNAREYAADNRKTALTDLAKEAAGDSWQAWNMNDINRFMSGEPRVIEAQDWQPELVQRIDDPDWRLETLPVNDPDGEPLGYALHIIVYGGVEQEQVGRPPIAEDEQFRMLEVAHFETTQAADKFGKAFNSYLIPGLLEGPELAEEVARLEGHPVEWKTLNADDLKAYQSGTLALTRQLTDWHLYNPNAEIDARLEAEGQQINPTHRLATIDVRADEPQDKPTVPDFDL